MNRYRYTKILKDNNKTRFRSITNYPKITPKNSDKTYYSKEGDRWDTIAYKFYGDTTLSWIIARANPESYSGGFTLPIGTKLAIPTDTGNIVSELERINTFTE